MKEILPGCYMIPIQIVNAFLIEEDNQLTLIDTGYPGSAAKILQAVAELGKTPTDIRQILVTHCHADHSGSLAELKKSSGAPAYMHALDAQLVREGKAMRPFKPGPGLVNRLLVNVLSGASPNTVEPAEIEYEVQDDQELPFASGLRAIHAPGHCAGQLVFLWPRHGGLLFVADAASNMVRLGWSFIYEDLEEGKHSLAKLSDLKFEAACFGHGRPILKNASQRFKEKWGMITE